MSPASFLFIIAAVVIVPTTAFPFPFSEGSFPFFNQFIFGEQNESSNQMKSWNLENLNEEIHTQHEQLFPKNFPFSESPFPSFNHLKEDMLNLKNQMQELKEDIHAKHDLLKNLTSEQLAFKVELKNESASFEFGGCACKDFKCICCGLIEQLNELPVCYKYGLNASESRLEISSNETNFGSISMKGNLTDVCDNLFGEPSSGLMCLHFYAINKQEFNNIIISLSGCIDIKINNSDVQIKLGCFKMIQGGTSYKRGLISIHTPGATEYLNEENPRTENELLNKLNRENFVNFETYSNGFAKSEF